MNLKYIKKNLNSEDYEAYTLFFKKFQRSYFGSGFLMFFVISIAVFPSEYTQNLIIGFIVISLMYSIACKIYFVKEIKLKFKNTVLSTFMNKTVNKYIVISEFVILFNITLFYLLVGIKN